MKILELFSGSRSIGKVAEKREHSVFSVDNVDYPNTNWVGDILDWDYRLNEMQVGDLGEFYVPDVIWASPPCTDFSVACIGKKWVSGHEFKPRDKDLLGLKILEKTLEIIEFYLKENPNLIWYVENPRGKMRKAPHWKKFKHKRETITYCQYGDTRMKPTDIWTNDTNWYPRAMCKNGDPCHISAPRGSRTGTQGLKGNHERSKIPKDLCNAIIESAEELLDMIHTFCEQSETHNGYNVKQVKEYYLNSGFPRYLEEPFLSEYDDTDWIEHTNESELEL